jgi:hypothetical protein
MRSLATPSPGTAEIAAAQAVETVGAISLDFRGKEFDDGDPVGPGGHSRIATGTTHSSRESPPWT